MTRTALKSVPATVDMEAPILGLDGEPIQEKGAKVVLRDLCINALLIQTPEEKATEREKLDRFILAMRVRKLRHPKLTAEDVVLIKKRIGEVYPPLLVGRVFELIDPASIPEMEEAV